MFEELKSRLTGPFYTIFTPFENNKAQSIDFEVLDKYLNLLYLQGARKFYAMAYNSRYSQMSNEEIMTFNCHCAKTLKKLDEKNIVIVGDPIHCSTHESLEFTLHAKEAGCDLISLLNREKYFSDDQILDHFQYIGKQSDFPLLVHEMPFLSGADGTQMHWPKNLIARLPEVPQIAALKEDAKDLEITLATLKLEPQIRIILAGGGKERFRELTAYGVEAWLNGISIIDASIAERFWLAINNNETDVQEFIIEQLEKPFFSGVVKKYGWHRVNKALLEAAGIMPRIERMPLKSIDDNQFVEVLEVCTEISETWRTWKNRQQ